MAVQIRGKTFTVGDRGDIVFKLRFFCDTEDDALFGIPLTYRNLLRSGRNGAEWDAGENKWIVNVTYRGLVAGDPGQDLDHYEITGEYREEPIEAFPDRQKLFDEFGAYIENDRLKFPEELPSFRESSTFGQAGGPSRKNPLFGVTTYPVYFEVAVHSFVRKQVPASLHRRKGTVIQSLPSGFEYNGDAQAWFVDAPRRRKVGNAWHMTQRYKEMDPVKHLEALYALIQP